MKIVKRLHKDNLTPAQQARFFRAFAAWSKARKISYIKTISAKEAWRLKYTWEAWARDDQLAPSGDWSVWICQAGRGWARPELAHSGLLRGLSAILVAISRWLVAQLPTFAM